MRTLEHVVPHTRVPAASLHCQATGHCASFHPSEHLLPTQSLVKFAYTGTAVVAGAPVTELVNKALAAFSRPVDPLHAAGPRQVDAIAFEAFLSKFVDVCPSLPLSFAGHFDRACAVRARDSLVDINDYCCSSHFPLQPVAYTCPSVVVSPSTRTVGTGEHRACHALATHSGGASPHGRGLSLIHI